MRWQFGRDLRLSFARSDMLSVRQSGSVAKRAAGTPIKKVAMMELRLPTAAEGKAPKTRRGRPSREAIAEIDARILEAAWQAFLAQGFDGTSMEAVADWADVTKTTLYLRHVDKLALLRAVIADRTGKWSERSRLTDWTTGRTLEERLIQYARTMLRWSQHPEVIATRRLVEGSIGEAGHIARELDRALRDPMIDLLVQEISCHAIMDGDPPSDPREVVRIFMGMVDAVRQVGEAQKLDSEALSLKAEVVVGILLRGRSAW